MDLNSIKDPSFLKELDIRQLNQLSSDIREFLITNISKTGGHLSSNLGVVELTIALHYVFNSPKDKIFFDVGHQSYVHKILTGRANCFDTLRKYNGLSGFQKRIESKHDVWEAGHSSTALSAAVAMAIARDLDNQDYEVIPVIGDAAMVGGESLEALNHLGSIKNKVIIILNDNQMAIGKSVGGFGEFLSSVRLSGTYNNLKQDYRNITAKNKFGQMIFNISKRVKDFIKHGLIDDTIFEDFGVDYLGPVNGHDFEDLIRVLNLAKKSKSSVVIHIVTKKGRGYKYAENDFKGNWHGIAPFNIDDGTIKTPPSKDKISWSKMVADHIELNMAKDKDVVAITPAMIHGSCMDNLFEHFPNRSFDVGIAEEHALTFTAGLAIAKKKPFISVYSSFLQRAYDQINHDLARMNLGSVIAIDRAGLVGADGETHHGVFDIGILKPIPNLYLFAPSCKEEVDWYLQYSFNDQYHVHCLRFPKATIVSRAIDCSSYDIGKWQMVHSVNQPKAIFITYGPCLNDALAYINEHQLDIMLVNACFLKPYDISFICSLAQYHCPIYVYETDLKQGGLAMDIEHILYEHHLDIPLISYGLEDHYVKQGTVDQLLDAEGLNLIKILEKVGNDIHG